MEPHSTRQRSDAHTGCFTLELKTWTWHPVLLSGKQSFRMSHNVLFFWAQGLVVVARQHVILCFGRGVARAWLSVSRNMLHFMSTSHQKNLKNLQWGYRKTSALFYGGRRGTVVCDFSIISPFEWEVKAFGEKNVVSYRFLIARVCKCVCVNWLQTHKERAEQHFFMGPLTAEGPKPQALPRPTLLCNSCPKAIMRGACQTGPALSHHHTLIQALYHIHERPLELYSWLAWVEIEIHALIRSAVMTVRRIAGSPFSCCHGGLMVCFEAKVRNTVTNPPSGVFTVGLHWCCNIVMLLSVLYSKALDWRSGGKRGYQQLGFTWHRLKLVIFIHVSVQK